MKTASFFTFSGPGSIGISLGKPRGMTVRCGFYRNLAPRREMLRMPYQVYRDVYFREILGPLDPRQVMDDLQLLAGDSEPVILCFERPPFHANNWCHRRWWPNGSVTHLAWMYRKLTLSRHLIHLIKTVNNFGSI